jgi:TfoX N-terminal domain
MPAMEKSPPELVERFASVLDRHPDLERRKMFGYPAGFIGGNLATSLFNDRWVVRLGDADREELLRLEGAGQFEPMPGRAMKGFALVPPSIVEDDTAIDGWVDRAIAHARSLPAKK